MSAFSLLRTRRFLPYFIAQFTGAFNDSLIRRAVEMLIAFKALSGSIAPQTAIFSLLALFMAPFFICSAFAGYLADATNKEKLVQYIKIAEVSIIVIASLALWNHSFILSAAAILGLGTHSSFFGPVKFSLPPQHLEKNQLIAGNGLIEAGTNIAILVGTILGSVLILIDNGELYVSGLAFTAALVGLVASFNIPIANPISNISFKRKSTWGLLKSIYKNESIWRISLGVSWFWTLGAVLISLFSLIVKDVLHSPEIIVSVFFAIFSIGVGAGSMLCNKILKGQIAATFVPLASLGMSFGLLSFYKLLHIVAGQGIQPSFLFTSVNGILISLSLFILSLSAGLFIVPLYGLLQSSTTDADRSQTIAANNILNAFLMVAGSVGLTIYFQWGGTVENALLILAGINIITAAYTCLLIPEHLFRGSLQIIFNTLFKARVEGLEHISSMNGRALLIANHLSFLDAVMLAAFLPGRVTFAVNTVISKRWWMKPVMVLMDAIPLDPMNPMAIRVLVDRLKEDKKVMIFPEGRLTITGSLMKIYDGPGLIADKAQAPIIPIRLDGFQFTLFSRVSKILGWKLFPQLSLSVRAPQRLHVPTEIRGRQRRDALALALHDVMTNLMYQTHERGPTILHSIHRVGRMYGFSKIVAKDPMFGEISSGNLIKKSFVLSRILSKVLPATETTGLLLPSGIPLLLFFLSLHWIKKLPALLNYSHSPIQMEATCKLSKVQTIVTSKKFITVAKLEKHLEKLTQSGIQIIYTDDISNSVSSLTKLAYLLFFRMQRLFGFFSGKDSFPGDSSDSAVVLFTSGSEGTPKGVVLSHENLLHNVDQVTSTIPLQTTDKVFNALPMFHSFGLTGGTLMPILKGAQALLYPSPLHYRIIPELVYNEASTILFGTPTFLAGYAKKAHPYDFNSLRYIFSGAERLSDSVRTLYQEKFGIRVFEGYGATETAPVISVNTPFQTRTGTVGRLVPGIEHRLEKVPGIDDGGRLFVKGSNVMKGYFKIDAPGVLQPLTDGWYDTGDIVSVDEKGFITIKGRAKRFAKIGGEMISLTAIEQYLEATWSNAQFAVVSVSDERKGEKLILVTTLKDATRESISHALRSHGCSELSIPKEIRIQTALPLLGSGKVDIQTLSKSIS